MIRVEKRLPFGFRGDWGKLYKPYKFDAETNNVVEFQGVEYVELKNLVQFKKPNKGLRSELPQKIRNMLQDYNFDVIETTDAYLDRENKEFSCVVEPGDVIKVFGRLWKVKVVEENNIFTPKKQSFYYIQVKEI